MINPEKEAQNHSASSKKTENQTNENKDTNWDEHQQIDEEGNEVDPHDVK